MPLEESVGAEGFAQVPEQFKDWYRQEGDKYVLDVVPRKINNGTLEAKRKAEQEAAKLKTSLEGVDLEEARALLDEKRKRETEESAKKGDFEGALARERQKLKATHDKELAERDARITAGAQREVKYARDEALTKAALKAGVIQGAIEDVLLLGGAQLSVKDGVLVDSDGDKVDPEKWLKEVLTKRKHWLGANSGGNTPPKINGPAPSGDLKRSKMNAEEKALYQKEYGFDAYNKLPF